MNIKCLIAGHIKYLKVADKPKLLKNGNYSTNMVVLKHCMRCDKHIDSNGYMLSEIFEKWGRVKKWRPFEDYI